MLKLVTENISQDPMKAFQLSKKRERLHTSCSCKDRNVACRKPASWMHLLPASPALPEVTGAAPQAYVSRTFQHQPPRAVCWLERTRPNPASYYLSPGCGGNFGRPHLQLCFRPAVGNKPLLQLLISLKSRSERLPPVLWDRTCCFAPRRPSGGLGDGLPPHTSPLTKPRRRQQLRSHNLPWKVRSPLTRLTPPHLSFHWVTCRTKPRSCPPPPPEGPTELSRHTGFAAAGQVPPPQARSLGSPSPQGAPAAPGRGPPHPGAAEGRGGAARPRHLPMSELQKASCGWMGTQVQASTTKSRRLQLQRNTTRKLSHAVMLPPKCLLTSAEQEGSRRSVRRAFLFSLPNSPRSATACLPPSSHCPSLCLSRWPRQRSLRRCEPEGTAGPRLPAAGGCRAVRSCAAPRRAGARSYSLDRALSGSGGAASPDQWEPRITSSAGEASGPGAGPRLQRLIRNSAGSAGRAGGRLAVRQVAGRSEEKSPSLSPTSLSRRRGRVETLKN